MVLLFDYFESLKMGRKMQPGGGIFGQFCLVLIYGEQVKSVCDVSLTKMGSLLFD